MAERKSKHPTDKLPRPMFGLAMSGHCAELTIKTDEFLAGTAHLSAEQLGCYCRLLFTICRDGWRIPETEAELARISGVSLRRWQAISEPVLRMLAVFSQKRLSPRHLRQEAPPAPRFDYSSAARSEIEATVGTLLSERQWIFLRDAADQFQSSCVERDQKTYLKPSERAAACAKAAQRCGESRKALEAFAKTLVKDGDWRDALFLGISEELSVALTAKKRMRVCGPWQRMEVVSAGASDGLLLTFGEVVDLLEAIESELREVSHPFYWKVSKVTSVTGRLDPSVVYVQRILWLWVKEFFGDLKCSWNPVAGEDCGPLVRYFFSVARPVMGPHTPSPQSLKKIIERQKQFSEWYWALMRDSGMPGVDVGVELAQDLESLRALRQRELKHAG
jgi:uncharacterized protein YdaU (DUF1376 family)